LGVKTTSLSLSGADSALGSMDELDFRMLASLSLTCAQFNKNYRLSTEKGIAKTIVTTKTAILTEQVTIINCATNLKSTPASLDIFFRVDFFARQSGFTNEVDAFNKITTMMKAATTTSTALAELISTLAHDIDPTLPPLGIDSFEVTEPLEVVILVSPDPTSQPTRVPVDEAEHINGVVIFTSSMFVCVLFFLLGSFTLERKAVATWKKQVAKKQSSASGSGSGKALEWGAGAQWQRPDGDMLHYSQRSIDETTALISSAVPCMREDLVHRYAGPAGPAGPGARGLDSPVGKHMAHVGAAGRRDRARDRGCLSRAIAALRHSNLFTRDVWRTHRWLGCLFFQPERSRLQEGAVRAGTMIVALFAASIAVFGTAPELKVELLEVELPLGLYVACFVSGLCVVSALAERVLEPLVHYCFSAYLDVRVLFAEKGSKVAAFEPPRQTAVGRINDMFENEAAFSAGGNIAGAGFSDTYITHVLEQRMTYADYIGEGGNDGDDEELTFELVEQRRRHAQQSAVDYSSKIQEDVAGCRSALLALAAPATLRSLDRLILEFDEVWGLDVDGKFSEEVDDGGDSDSDDEAQEGMLAMCWKHAACRRGAAQQSSFQALVADLFAVNQMAADEQKRKYFTFGVEGGEDGETAAVAVKRRQRLVQLFLLDTLPPLSAAVVNSQILRSQDFIPPPTKPFNTRLHLTLMALFFLVLAACLVVTLYLGTVLNNHDQSMVLFIFLTWLCVDMVLTSTLAMFVKHYAFPLLVRDDVKNAMYWLVNRVDRRQHMASSAQAEGAPLIHGESAESAAPAWLSLDASKHFFVSTKLALLTEEPQLERDAILSFKTLWPKRSYGSNKGGSMYEYNQMVTVGYSKYPAQWLQNPFMRQSRGVLLGHVYHMLSALLLQFYTLSVPTQDTVTNLVCAALAVGLALMHYWLALMRTEFLALPACGCLAVFLLVRLANRYFFHPGGAKLRVRDWLLQAWCCCYQPAAYNKITPVREAGAAAGSPSSRMPASAPSFNADEDLSREVADRVARIKLERARSVVAEVSSTSVPVADYASPAGRGSRVRGFSGFSDDDDDQSDFNEHNFNEDDFGEDEEEGDMFEGDEDVRFAEHSPAHSPNNGPSNISRGRSADRGHAALPEARQQSREGRARPLADDGPRAHSADFSGRSASTISGSFDQGNVLLSKTSGKNPSHTHPRSSRVKPAQKEEGEGGDSTSGWFDRPGSAQSSVLSDSSSPSSPSAVALRKTHEGSANRAQTSPEKRRSPPREQEEPEPEPAQAIPSAAAFMSQVASQNDMLGRGLSRGLTGEFSEKASEKASPPKFGRFGTQTLDIVSMVFSDSDSDSGGDGDEDAVPVRVGNKKPSSGR
jgi:hypothetical protein